ncbi:hypothetical protein HPB50_016073 [Hyalomma asiaticum]|uniref:Uncharacterized protein n=1 Tax=Hyalomma asiaticum TaxID=266040 RepID=A0ACB7T2X7_HYAAI|nr:hypothetical protein HPB50_016073 [Hyalomma asiaticum]
MSLSFDLPVLVRVVLVRSLKQTAHNKLELQLDLHTPAPPVERTLDTIEYSLRAVAHNGTFSRCVLNSSSHSGIAIVTNTQQFHHLASAVFGALERLHSRMASIPHWDGGMKYVRFADARDALLSFTTTERLLNVSNDVASIKGYFDGDSELATGNPERVKGFAAFAVEQGGARLVNLVRYLVVERLLPVSSFNLAEIYNITEKDAFRVRVAACRQEVVGLTPRGWADLVFRNLLSLNYSAADALARDVLDAAIAHVSAGVAGGVWTADAETSERAKQRLQRTRLLLGRVAVKDSLKQRYGHIKAPNASKPFVKWLLQTLQLGCKLLFATLSRDSAAYYKDMHEPELQVLDSNPNAMLDPVRQEVLVTPAVLFPPFLAGDVPSAVNYGAIGSLLGSLLAQSLDPSVGAYDILGRRVAESWFSEPSLSARKDTLSCISAKMAAYDKGSPSDSLANEVLANTMGLRIAHAAFLGKLDENDTRKAAGDWDGPYFSGGDVTGLHRLFFAAHCFQLCGVSLPRGVATSALPLRHRCNLPLMNYAEFGRAFGCPANSTMAPTDNCFSEP